MNTLASLLHSSAVLEITHLFPYHKATQGEDARCPLFDLYSSRR